MITSQREILIVLQCLVLLKKTGHCPGQGLGTSVSEKVAIICYIFRTLFCIEFSVALECKRKFVIFTKFYPISVLGDPTVRTFMLQVEFSAELSA